MPKRSSKINERERGICVRVRQIREKLKWSQLDFAREMGITRDQQASIEYACTPLRHDLAHLICQTFDVSGEWLATGKGKMHSYSSGQGLWTVEDRRKLTARALLSEAYDYQPWKFAALKLAQTELPKFIDPDFDIDQWMRNTFESWSRRFKFINVTQAREFAVLLNRFLQRKTRAAIARGAAVSRPKIFFSKDNLDETKSKVILAPVDLTIPTWPELKKKIALFTLRRGEKAALAETLGVSRQVLGNWLSQGSQGAPNAATTLILLAWVTAEEAQQNKNPERESPRPGPKTRSRKNSYEEPKSNPRKK